MLLSCLEKPSMFTPYPIEVYGDGVNCCYTVDCELRLSPGDSSRVITNLITDYTSGCPFDILEVNGAAYTNPIPVQININPGQSIFLKLQVCPCGGVGTTWNADFIIDYKDTFGNATETITYGFTEINPQGLTTNPIDPAFSTLDVYPCIGTSNCAGLIGGTIPITNHSDFIIDVVIDDGGNFPVGTVFYLNGILLPGNILPIPPKTSMQIGFGFCWPNSTTTNFDVDVLFCPNYAQKITFYINPVQCFGCGIGCLDFTIDTESGLLPTANLGCGYGLPNVYKNAAVGEYKTAIFHYAYNYGFANADVDIYFNPYLFTDIASILPIDPYSLSIPNVGWHRKVQGFMVGGGPYPMQQVTGSQYQSNQKNWDVQIEIINNNEFKIFFSFYFMMDIDNGITNTYIDNYRKLIYNNIYAQIGDYLTSIGQDVYKADNSNPRYFAKDILLIDNNVSDPTSTIDRPFRCYFYDSFPLAARWYNNGIGLNAPEFTTPTFYFYRNGNPWTPRFSIFDKTKVTFLIDIPAAYTCTSMVAYIINVNEFDNTVDFKTNYDFSRAQITTNPGSGVINNLIEAPTVGPTNQGPAPSGGSYWSIEFTVGAANVSATGEYLIGIIVYDATHNIVNTFCYPNLGTTATFIGVDTTPSESSLCCPLNIQAAWSDYINTYTNVYPHVTNYKQRLLNTLNVSGGQFQTNCLLGNFGYFQSWQTLIKDVTLNVYSKRPTGFGSFYKFIYYQYQSIRDISYPSDFNNLSNDFIVKNIGSGQLQMDWFDRGRWENWIQFPSTNVYNSNQLTPYNLNNVGPINGQIQASGWNITYDWSNKLNPTDIGGEILFDYIIRFDLTSVLNLPNNQPFYVNKLIQQSLWVYPEEPLTTNTQFGSAFGDLFFPLLVEGWNGSAYVTIQGPICPNQYEHVKVTLNDISGGLSGYMIGFINKSPYGITTIKEDDAVGASPSSFTQLDSQYIYDVTPGLATGTWEFKVDVNAMPSGNYELCAQFLPL